MSFPRIHWLIVFEVFTILGKISLVKLECSLKWSRCFKLVILYRKKFLKYTIFNFLQNNIDVTFFIWNPPILYNIIAGKTISMWFFLIYFLFLDKEWNTSFTSHSYQTNSSDGFWEWYQSSSHTFWANHKHNSHEI